MPEQTQTIPLQQRLIGANAHHQAGRLREAELGYRQILAEQPDCADALYLLGLIENHLGRREQAVELILRAAKIVPNNAEIYHNLGLILGSMGRNDDALAALRHAVKLNPRPHQYHY